MRGDLPGTQRFQGQLGLLAPVAIDDQDLLRGRLLAPAGHGPREPGRGRLPRPAVPHGWRGPRKIAICSGLARSDSGKSNRSAWRRPLGPLGRGLDRTSPGAPSRATASGSIPWRDKPPPARIRIVRQRDMDRSIGLHRPLEDSPLCRGMAARNRGRRSDRNLRSGAQNRGLLTSRFEAQTVIPASSSAASCFQDRSVELEDRLFRNIDRISGARDVDRG